jgi:hypothetical protein
MVELRPCPRVQSYSQPSGSSELALLGLNVEADQAGAGHARPLARPTGASKLLLVRWLLGVSGRRMIGLLKRVL